MSIQSFDADLEKYLVVMGVGVDKAVRTIAMDLYNNITQMTPIDTGRAKGNWNTGIGAPDTSISENATTVKPFKAKIGDGLKAIYITNNLPYINKLEYGSSQKAPNGMVRVSINNFKMEMNSVI